MRTYQVIARTLGALRRCEQTPETHQDWIDKHSVRLEELLGDFPSGSGFDSGTKLADESTPEKLVFNTSFHHMNENGMYDGWTEHQVIVTASLEMGSSVKVTGRDRNDIKSYISECFHHVLDAAALYDQGPKRKGPLRRVVGVLAGDYGTNLFGSDTALLECGHISRSYGGKKAICVKCREGKPMDLDNVFGVDVPQTIKKWKSSLTAAERLQGATLAQEHGA